MKWINKKIDKLIERIGWRTYRIFERELIWKGLSDIGVDSMQKVIDKKKEQGIQYLDLAEEYIKIMRERKK